MSSLVHFKAALSQVEGTKDNVRVAHEAMHYIHKTKSKTGVVAFAFNINLGKPMTEWIEGS